MEERKKSEPHAYDVWFIKKQVRISFKRLNKPPETQDFFYSIGRVIGRGSYGKVNLGIHKLVRKLVAIKSINRVSEINHPQRWVQVQEEVKILQQVRHKNIIKFFEYLKTDKYDLYFMELCQGGDLLQYVKRRKKLDEPIAKFLFRQIIVGLGYLHKKNIIHRDIKLENILIDNEGVVKIADFGASLIVPAAIGDCTKPQKKLDHPVGTPAYMSPEMTESGKGNKNKGVKYNYKTDIWGAGIVLFVMIYGHLPFTGDKSRSEEQTQTELFAAIKTEQVFCKETVSIPCIKLINSLLDKVPKNRLDIGQILNHPWFSHNEKERGDVFNEFEVDKIKSGFLFRDLELDRNDHVNPRLLNDDFMHLGKKYSKEGYRIITKNH